MVCSDGNTMLAQCSWSIDYFNSIVSLVVRVGNNLIAPSKGSFPFRQLIRLLAPFVTILGLFAAFVLWNGGVVLGELTISLGIACSAF